MKLANLIKGSPSRVQVATATPATFATDPARLNTAVATIATVAASNPPDSQMGEFSGAEELMVRKWLRAIGETDPALIDQSIYYCRTDSRSKQFFLSQARAFEDGTTSTEGRELWEK